MSKHQINNAKISRKRHHQDRHATAMFHEHAVHVHAPQRDAVETCYSHVACGGAADIPSLRQGVEWKTTVNASGKIRRLTRLKLRLKKEINKVCKGAIMGYTGRAPADRGSHSEREVHVEGGAIREYPKYQHNGCKSQISNGNKKTFNNGTDQ